LYNLFSKIPDGLGDEELSALQDVKKNADDAELFNKFITQIGLLIVR